mgnify:CR=1 FL=1
MNCQTKCPAIRVVMFPKDTNPSGNIFGGVILSNIDIAAGVDHVEAAGEAGEFAVGGEEVFGGEHDPPAFAGVDRGRTAAETRIASIAHLDEDQRLAVAHHQVEFAAAGVRVGGHGQQAAFAQEGGGQRFDVRTAGASGIARRISRHACPAPRPRRR